jgi:ABC-2 type transport system ATP-binding protein
LISIDRVSKKFGDKEVVHDLSLDISRGELFAYLGPNGAGKTTTIKMLTGLLKPTSGRILVNGHDIQTQPMSAKKSTGYVPDLPYLYEKLTAAEFLTFIGNLYGLDGRLLDEKIQHFLTLFDLSDFKGMLIEDLSHGMRQRLVFSAALLVKDVLREKADDGTTIFLSTHSLSIAQELADRIGIIHGGRLIALGSYEDLSRSAGKGDDLEDIFLQLTADDGNAPQEPSAEE